MNLRWAALLLTSLCLNRGALAQAGPGADNVTLQSLLTEVRQLRLAVERVTSVWPQTQLVLQRMQIQQQHVELLSRQLEQLRDQIAKSAVEAAGMAGELKQAEARVSQEQDARRRQDLEDGIRRAKAHIEQQATRDQLQQGQESQLAGLLQIEQAKLNDLNARLDALERLLQTPPAKQP